MMQGEGRGGQVKEKKLKNEIKKKYDMIALM